MFNKADKADRKLLVKNEVSPRPTRCAVLRELSNRVPQSSSTSLGEAQRKLPSYLKNVKPRVNTFWKKEEFPGKISRTIGKPTKVRKVPNMEKAASLAQPETNRQIERSAVEEFETDASECHSNNLLNDVIDIDARDEDSLIHMTEYVKDIFNYIVELEKKFLIEKEYMAKHEDLTPRMRSILVDWINKVHYQFRFVPETYYICVGLIDRYLQQRKKLSRKLLQLVGITALLLASKKLPSYLKNVKPRVNTFWKKEEFPGKISRTIGKPTKGKNLPGSMTNVAIVKPFVARKVSNMEKAASLAQPETNRQIERSAVEEFASDASECHSNNLLSDVIDIDAGDENSLIHLTEYVKDIFNYFVELEKKFPIEKEYMAKHEDLTPRMRSILVDWINKVHYQFRFVPETYYICVGLIDRYLQQRKKLSRKLLQLVGITALLLASKYEEMRPPSIHDFFH
uniref:Putative cyclin b n=1 Tax=Lutzomyia longipalpis TaxID=7200 RepID=A0A1B0C8Z6_LUTLO